MRNILFDESGKDFASSSRIACMEERKKKWKIVLVKIVSSCWRSKVEIGRGRWVTVEAGAKCFVTFPSFAIMRHGAIYKVSK